MQTATGLKVIKSSDYATFYLHDALCGIALNCIEEINKPTHLTVVPQAPDYVTGLINLRGKIVTVIDMNKRLGLSPSKAGKDQRTLIVNDGEESVGLMVDRVSNVVRVEPRGIDAPPANIGNISGRCFDAVYKTDTQLIGLLSLDSLRAY